MAKNISIKVGQIKIAAELNDTETAQAIWDVLPIKASGNRWGDEIYFAIPVALDEENAQAVVAVGDLAYWPTGNAFCIFFGPTPMSSGAEPVPASPCNVFGKITGEATILKQVPSGAEIIIEREN